MDSLLEYCKSEHFLSSNDTLIDDLKQWYVRDRGVDISQIRIRDVMQHLIEIIVAAEQTEGALKSMSQMAFSDDIFYRIPVDETALLRSLCTTIRLTEMEYFLDGYASR